MSQKVTARHLRRDAYLYVRQSTMRQVIENTESAERQYGLRDKAVALGWPLERIVVIDGDQGHSAASAADRAGFQRLVAEVGLGHVGIVLGLEVSRLARSSSDWHRLLEICALSDTLILDEDGVYDPGLFNDRLLLGLKGTLSEAELHVLRARMRGGLLNKARRGELRTPLPIGLVYGPDDRVQLDPDQQVQHAVRVLLETFRRTGSAFRTAREFHNRGMLFPRRPASGPHRGEVLWRPLQRHAVLAVLRNPRYAGAFFFGRTRSHRVPGGTAHTEQLPLEQWVACFPQAHPGYLSWEEYQDNLRRLAANARAYNQQRRHGPPREGSALVQGLAVCGRCGRRMGVSYHVRSGGRLVPQYVCNGHLTEEGGAICQRIPGGGLDEAIADLLVASVTPLALEVALSVQQELVNRAEEADRLRRQQVQRARYETDLARRRYLQVDPDNRLVADALEADWNAKLRELAAAQEIYERQRQEDTRVLNEEQRREVLALATDFPRLWRDSRTTDRERKRMAALILEDVTLIRDQRITAHVRFKGGASRTVTVPLPLPAAQLRKTDAEVVRLVDTLLEQHTDGEVAAELNRRGLGMAGNKPFTARGVQRLRKTYGVISRFRRLRARGLLTLDEVAETLGVCRATVYAWRRAGLLRAHRYADRGEHLFEHPSADVRSRVRHKASGAGGMPPGGIPAPLAGPDPASLAVE